MRRSTCLLLVAGLLAATVSASTHAKNSRPPAAKASALDLPNVAAKAPVRSRVPFVVGIELSWVKQQLEERVPLQLHRETQREVAPGILLDAKVTREAFALGIVTDGAVVSAPIILELEARSRLGSIVVPLGRCRSTIDFELGLVTRLGSDGKLSRPKATAEIREPCRLAAFDVTPLIRREIAQRLATAERQIETLLDRANGQLTQMHADLFRTLSNPDAGCVRFVPDKVLQTPMADEQGVATLHFVAEGMVVHDCAVASPPPILVEPTVDRAELDLAWSRRIQMVELGELVTQRFAADGIAAVTTKIRAVRRDDIDQLAIYLRLPKEEGWIVAQPEVREQQLRLVGLSSKQAQLLKLARPSLEAVAVPIDTVAAELLARKQLAAANELSMVFGTSPNVKARFELTESGLETAYEVRLDPDALVVVVRRRQVN